MNLSFLKFLAKIIGHDSCLKRVNILYDAKRIHGNCRANETLWREVMVMSRRSKILCHVPILYYSKVNDSLIRFHFPRFQKGCTIPLEI